MKGSKFSLTLLIAVLSGLLCYSNPALSRTQYDIKAAYLYNFIKFVNWPDEENKEQLHVCLYGDDPINEKLSPLNSVKIRSLQAKLSEIDNPEQTADCDVLYVSAEKRKRIDELVDMLEGKSVLLVSDIEGFAKKGGIIEFITLGNVIRFNINFKKARSTELAISSKLLELANNVTR